MMQYECKKCSKTFTRKDDYLEHCNKSVCAFDSIDVGDIIDIDLSTIINYPIYTYDNPSHSQYIKDLIVLGSQFPLSKIHNKHILYFCIIKLDTAPNDVLIKIGYTDDIVAQLKKLTDEYCNEAFFISGKIIHCKNDKNEFQHLLELRYPHLVDAYTIKSHKPSIFKFSPILLEEYINYLNDCNNCSNQDELSIMNTRELIRNVQTNSDNNLTINLVVFAKDGIKDLSASDLREILTSGNNLIAAFIINVNCNPNKPTHHNVYYSDTESAYGEVYGEDKKWDRKKISEILDTLIDAKLDDLNEILNKMIFLDKKTRNRIKLTMEQFDISHKISRNKLKAYLKLMLCNNKDIILNTKNITTYSKSR